MKLKNILSILVVCFSFAFSGIAQEKYATSQSRDDLRKANQTGTYTFVIPEKITAEDVALSAEFYTVYFTVDFDASKHRVVLKLNGLEEKNRQVIARFFISLGIRQIMVDNELYEVQDFYSKFLSQAKTDK